MADPETNADDFLKDVIEPVLKDMAMDGAAAEKLLMMTACQESMGFRYRVQQGGPALSYFQVEPNTLNDLYENYLAFRPDMQALVDAYLPEELDRLEALETDDKYACAVARMIYWRVPEALPHVLDDEGLAAYAKKYWNTEQGAATAQKYLDDYRRYGPNPEPVGWA
ncbi:hypothetical protein [Kordiimonas lacus]|uniref:Uncharacterized protein n=1 Tax=Kordiimonas lacus TaxID=637679 RepID=A0A1G6TG88_9PROT|nr:hypothetical protein [Kordiimonas lacus]SDD28061.1 hypothetical protein SAMN04488071_0226 [Kordiimonas lacus]